MTEIHVSTCLRETKTVAYYFLRFREPARIIIVGHYIIELVALSKLYLLRVEQKRRDCP